MAKKPFSIFDFTDELWPGENEDAAKFNALENFNVQLETNEFVPEDRPNADWGEIDEDLEDILDGEDDLLDIGDFEIFIYSEQ